jgi:DNA repair exonuclease SbcCD ATPase subunit
MQESQDDPTRAGDARVSLARAAELVGVHEARLVRLAAEKRLQLTSDGRRTLVALAELRRLYPEIAEQAEAPGAAESGAPAPDDPATEAAKTGTPDAPAEAIGPADRGVIDGSPAPRTAGLDRTGSIRRQRRGSERSGSAEVEVYRRKRPDSIRRLEEQHQAELDQRQRRHDKELRELRASYDGQIENLKHRLTEQDRELQQLRQELARLRRADAADGGAAGEPAAEESAELARQRDAAVARADRLAEECQALLEVNAEQNERIARLKRERDAAQRLQTYEREVALHDRWRLRQILERMAQERRQRTQADRAEVLTRLARTVAGRPDG